MYSNEALEYFHVSLHFLSLSYRLTTPFKIFWEANVAPGLRKGNPLIHEHTAH